MARHRLDGANHFLISDLIGGAGEAGVAAVHEDGEAAVGVAAQGGDQRTPFGVVEGAEVHDRSPSYKVTNQTTELNRGQPARPSAGRSPDPPALHPGRRRTARR